MISAKSKSGKHARTFQVGEWLAEPRAGTLLRDGSKTTVEPKVMDLLLLLAKEPGRVYSREEIESLLWPNVVVGEDSLSRTISKLRRALGDSASSPTYIETIPKRGYRLIAELGKPGAAKTYWFATLSAIVVMGVLFLLVDKVQLVSDELPSLPTTENSKLTHRADDLYMQFTRADNEAAITLYERVLADDPDYVRSQAGLANALVQRVVRWQNKPSEPQINAPSLSKALSSGLTETADGRAILSRAAAIAERAARLAPDDPQVLKALAFTYSAKGELDRASQIYLRAVDLDENAWAPLINLGEIYLIQGNKDLSLETFEKAYAAMDRVYAQEPHKVGPWQAPLGILIGDGYHALGSTGDAERWYRRVLNLTPLELTATTRLAHVLRETGRSTEAKELCKNTSARVGAFDGCTSALSTDKNTELDAGNHIR